MAVIRTPVEGWSGWIGSVEFVDGVAETNDPGVLSYCRDAGYSVTEPVTEPVAEPVVEPVVEPDVEPVQMGSPLLDLPAPQAFPRHRPRR